MKTKKSMRKKILWGVILFLLLSPVVCVNAEESSKKEKGAYAAEEKETTLLLKDVSQSMRKTFAEEVKQMKMDEQSFLNYREFSDNGKTNLYDVLNESLTYYDSVSIITDLWDTTNQDLKEVKGKDLRIYVPYKFTDKEAVEHVEDVVYQHISPFLKDSFVKVIYLDKEEGVIYITSPTAIQIEEEAIKETEIEETQELQTVEEVEPLKEIAETTVQENVVQSIPEKSIKDSMKEMGLEIISFMKEVLKILGKFVLGILLLIIVIILFNIIWKPLSWILNKILEIAVIVFKIFLELIMHTVQAISHGIKILLNSHPIIITAIKGIGNIAIEIFKPFFYLVEVFAHFMGCILYGLYYIVSGIFCIISLFAYCCILTPIASIARWFIYWITIGRIITLIKSSNTVIINYEIYPKKYQVLEGIIKKLNLFEDKIIISFNKNKIAESLDFSNLIVEDEKGSITVVDALNAADDRGASKVVLFSDFPRKIEKGQLDVSCIEKLSIISPEYYIFSESIFLILKEQIESVKNYSFPQNES